MIIENLPLQSSNVPVQQSAGLKSVTVASKCVTNRTEKPVTPTFCVENVMVIRVGVQNTTFTQFRHACVTGERELHIHVWNRYFLFVWWDTDS